jgi:hypothetical protein
MSLLENKIISRFVCGHQGQNQRKYDFAANRAASTEIMIAIVVATFPPRVCFLLGSSIHVVDIMLILLALHYGKAKNNDVKDILDSSDCHMCPYSRILYL